MSSNKKLVKNDYIIIKNVFFFLTLFHATRPAFTCSNSTIGMLEKRVKYVQS